MYPRRYFKFSRWTLPMEYNALVGASHTISVAGRNVTFGGAVSHLAGGMVLGHCMMEWLPACDAAPQTPAADTAFRRPGSKAHMAVRYLTCQVCLLVGASCPPFQRPPEALGRKSQTM
jgi:hypothetical protein